MTNQSPVELKPHGSKIPELIGAEISMKLLGFMGRAVLSMVFPTRIFIISSKFRTRSISTISRGPVVSLGSRLIYLKLTPRHSNTPMIAKAWPRHLATGTADGITSGVVCAPPPGGLHWRGAGAGREDTPLRSAPRHTSSPPADRVARPSKHLVQRLHHLASHQHSTYQHVSPHFGSHRVVLSAIF